MFIALMQSNVQVVAVNCGAQVSPWRPKAGSLQSSDFCITAYCQPLPIIQWHCYSCA